MGTATINHSPKLVGPATYSSMLELRLHGECVCVFEIKMRGWEDICQLSLQVGVYMLL